MAPTPRSLLVSLVSRVRSRLHSEQGATAIEYGLLAAGIGLAISLSVASVGTAITGNFYDKIIAKLTSVAGG